MVLNSKKFISLIMIFSLIFISVLAPVAKASESDKTKFLEEAIEIVPEKSDKKTVTRSETGQTEDFITGDVTLNTLTTRNVKPSEVEDYKIYKGDREIGLVEFLREIGDPKKAAEVEREMEDYNDFLGKSTVGSLAASVGGFALAASDEGGTMGKIGAYSMIGGITYFGYMLFSDKNTNVDYLNYQRAIRKAEIYNSELRNELGLSK